MKVLVYIETKEGAPVPGSLELLTAAKELGETVAVAAEDKAAAEKAAAYGAKVTVLKTGEASEDAQTAVLESYIREVQPELVLFSGTQNHSGAPFRIRSHPVCNCPQRQLRKTGGC